MTIHKQLELMAKVMLLHPYWKRYINLFQIVETGEYFLASTRHGLFFFPTDKNDSLELQILMRENDNQNDKAFYLSHDASLKDSPVVENCILYLCRQDTISKFIEACSKLTGLTIVLKNQDAESVVKKLLENIYTLTTPIARTKQLTQWKEIFLAQPGLHFGASEEDLHYMLINSRLVAQEQVERTVDIN